MIIYVTWPIHIWAIPLIIFEPFLTCMNESCKIYKWVASHTWSYTWHDPFIYEPFPIFPLKPHSHTWINHVTFTNESCHIRDHIRTWPIHIWAIPHIPSGASLTYMNKSCHIYEWVMSHIWSYTYMTHSYMSHSLQSLRNRCHIHERDMSQLHERDTSQI